jgi:deoxyribonuclease-4
MPKQVQHDRMFDRLNFNTAGMPHRTKGSYPEAFKILKEMDLDGMEMEFVHGVRMSSGTRELVRKLAAEQNILLTAHSPYYINLNAREEEKVEASIRYIVETAQAAKDTGAYSITYHAAFYLGQDKEEVYKRVQAQTARIIEIINKENINVWIRPETTGKPTQWGDLDEIIRLSTEFDKVLPCVDFAHLHARSNGKFNTYDEFAKILEKIGTEIGTYALENFHGHVAGIAYGEKGEKHHLNLAEADLNYKELLKAMKNLGVKGALTCETPNIEEDTKLLKDYYMSL